MIFIDQPAQVGFSYSVPVPGMYIRNYLLLLDNSIWGSESQRILGESKGWFGVILRNL